MSARYPPPDRNPFTSEHVRLERLTDDHAPDLWDLARRQPAGLFHHLFFGPFTDEQHVRAWIREASVRLSSYAYAIFSERLSACVGGCALLDVDTASGSAEIGSVWCGMEARGSEVIPAATRLLLAYLFDVCGYRRVVWKCDTTNVASRRAAEAMGFRHEGTFRNHMFIRGRSRDTAWYSVVDREWAEVDDVLARRIASRLAKHA